MMEATSQVRAAVYAGQRALHAARRMERELLDAGDTAGAAELSAAIDRLGTQIDGLLGRAFEGWTRDADHAAERLRDATQRAVAAGKEMETGMAALTTAVAFAGYIDAAAGALREVAAALR